MLKRLGNPRPFWFCGIFVKLNRSRGMMMTVPTAPTSPIRISFLTATEVVDNKVTRKLAEDDAKRAVKEALIAFERAARMAAWG